MEVTTDQDGYAYIDKELAAGKYYIRELEAADGYILDKQYSRGIALPRHHIFAVRQEDGTHRFFVSHEPEKI